MTWFIFSLSAVFALAGAELTQQHLLNKKNPFSPRTSAVLTFLVQSILISPLVIFSPLRNDIFDIFRPDILYRVILITFMVSVAMIFYLKSFQVKNISISSIFASSSVVVTTFLGIVFFNESISFIKFLGIALILITIVSLNYKNALLEKRHLYGLVSAVAFGIGYAIDKSIVQEVNPIVYIFSSFPLVSIFGFLLNPKEVINSVRNKSAAAYKPIIISGIGYLLYNLFTFNAYVFGGEVGKVDAINNSQVFLIILFEYFVLKHTKGTVRKLLTALVAFVGVLLLGYY